MQKVKKEYSLFTAVSMIIGIVIGSGIFFKADDILTYTGGNVFLGILVFIIAAISIVFGSLTVCQLALRTNEAGGVITYMEQSWSKSLSGSFGWFYSIIYMPTLVVVVSWVAGIYICQLFGINSTLNTQCLIGFIAMVVIFAINIYAKKLGDILQISSTVLKLIPLVFLAFAGIMLGRPANVTSTAIVANSSSFGFIAAIVPIAFAFDGWIISTSIAHEVKDAKRTLPLALAISPIIILCLYSAYLIGISALLGPSYILSHADSHLYDAANMLLGTVGANIILTFVVISVLGTVNGVVIGIMRMPYSLACRSYFPQSEKVAKIDEKLDIPVHSAVISLIICTVWYVVHYFVMFFDLGFDISEIAIVMNYVFFIALYIAVMKLYKKGEISGKCKGLVFPILATIGSLIIFFGSIINVSGEGGSIINIQVAIFMLISLCIILASKKYCAKQDK